MSGLIHFSYDSRNFYAAGKWIPADPKDKPAFPSETELDCFKNQQQCVEAIAEYYSGRPHVSTHYWQILKWDNNGIVATSTEGTCTNGTMVVSFGDKTISETDSSKVLDKDKREACAFLGAAGTQQWLFVLKGSDRWAADETANLK